MSDMSNKKIAITGTIGSGKSTVTKIISKYFPTISSDDIVAKLYDQEEFARMINLEFLTVESNVIDKQSLAKLIFKNEEKKSKLENLIHPIVREEIEMFFLKNSGITFVEVPLLFEANFDDLFDEVILVVADDEIVFSRMMEFRNYTYEDVKMRIENQYSVSDKLEKSDYVIYNNSDLSSLEIEVERVLDKIVRGKDVIR